MVLVVATLACGQGLAQAQEALQVQEAPQAQEALQAQEPAQGADGDRAITATRTLSRMRSTTNAQRKAAAARAMASGAVATPGAKRIGAARGASLEAIQAPAIQAASVVVCNAPTGSANADYMGLCPNWAYSPILRKFVDKLPGLGAANANLLGQYIPIAQAKPNPLYPSDDYYEIGLKEYRQRMHPDLPAVGTRLRGYVDLNVPSPATATPRYLGPLIVARRDKPVRIKFSNLLSGGAAGNLFIPVDRTYMGAGFGPDGVNRYTDNRADLHLHGGNTPWISDGTPHQWKTPQLRPPRSTGRERASRTYPTWWA